LGSQKCLYLGNLDAKRDWGHAKDYVRMQWMMLQEDIPQDFVIATGVQYSVRDFVNLAAKEIDLLISWEGQGVNEKGYDQDGNCIVSVDPKYFRPAEVETLLGDATQAKKVLGWEPEISFEELVSEMASEDMKIAKRDLLISKDG
jgi:GDPmannose 4,6-dehydratase